MSQTRELLLTRGPIPRLLKWLGFLNYIKIFGITSNWSILLLSFSCTALVASGLRSINCSQLISIEIDLFDKILKEPALEYY